MKTSKRPILIVIGNNKNGGMAKRAAMLVNGFSDIGRKATIVVTKNNIEETFFDLKENVNVITTDDVSAELLTRDVVELKLLKVFCRLLPDDLWFRNDISYEVSKRRANLKLRNTFKQHNKPIIVALGLENAVNSFYATKGMGADIVYATKTYAEGEICGYDKDKISGIIKKFSCVVCQTQYTARFFQKMGIRNINVVGNPLYVETPCYEGERNNSIVNFCRISREKRLDLLIKAFSVFHKEHPEYRVDIYGNIVSEGEQIYKEELLALIEELGLSASVTIHDAKKNIHEIIKNAAMFVSTSTFEGLSNSMIEAMALGMPCICTDCDGGGAREYIENGVNGLLISKDDETALVEALNKFTDKDFARKCGRKAAEIRNTLDINKILSEWEKVFDKYCS